MQESFSHAIRPVLDMVERQQFLAGVTVLLLALMVLGFLGFLGFLAFRMVRLQEQKYQDQKAPRGSATAFPDSKKSASVQELDLDPDARYRPR